MAERGGRERAALWLWHAHNVVNKRLAQPPADAEAHAAGSLEEFAKEPWP